MDFITPITIGILGSMHSLGMCGPDGVALRLKKQNLLPKIAVPVLFHSGRVISYSILGIFFGMLGRGLRLAGLQQWATILLGSAMLVSVLYPVIFREQISISGLFSGFSARLNFRMKRLSVNRTGFSLFRIGLLNGLLPCGLVFLAIAGAISSGNVWTGSLFMVCFGIATIPLLLVATRNHSFGQTISLKTRRLVPFLVLMLGLLFIFRGMSLGIPFVSPSIEQLAPKVMIEKGRCC